MGAVGAHVADVAVHVEQAMAAQERDDLGQLPVEYGRLADRVLA